MQIALTGTISRTLAKEQTGVGMGLLSMSNFLSGAVAAGVYSKAVDQGGSVHWNPLNLFANSGVYSNIYLILAALEMIMVLFYYFYFLRNERPRLQSSSIN